MNFSNKYLDEYDKYFVQKFPLLWETKFHYTFPILICLTIFMIIFGCVYSIDEAIFFNVKTVCLINKYYLIVGVISLCYLVLRERKVYSHYIINKNKIPLNILIYSTSFLLLFSSAYAFSTLLKARLSSKVKEGSLNEAIDKSKLWCYYKNFELPINYYDFIGWVKANKFITGYNEINERRNENYSYRHIDVSQFTNKEMLFMDNIHSRYKDLAYPNLSFAAHYWSEDYYKNLFQFDNMEIFNENIRLFNLSNKIPNSVNYKVVIESEKLFRKYNNWKDEESYKEWRDSVINQIENQSDKYDEYQPNELNNYELLKKYSENKWRTHIAIAIEFDSIWNYKPNEYINKSFEDIREFKDELVRKIKKIDLDDMSKDSMISKIKMSPDSLISFSQRDLLSSLVCDVSTLKSFQQKIRDYLKYPIEKNNDEVDFSTFINLSMFLQPSSIAGFDTHYAYSNLCNCKNKYSGEQSVFPFFNEHDHLVWNILKHALFYSIILMTLKVIRFRNLIKNKRRSFRLFLLILIQVLLILFCLIGLYNYYLNFLLFSFNILIIRWYFNMAVSPKSM